MPGGALRDTEPYKPREELLPNIPQPLISPAVLLNSSLHGFTLRIRNSSCTKSSYINTQKIPAPQLLLLSKSHLAPPVALHSLSSLA